MSDRERNNERLVAETKQLLREIDDHFFTPDEIRKALEVKPREPQARMQAVEEEGTNNE